MVDTILFVDDEENILNSLQRLFADTDLRVLRAGDGARALEIVRSEPVAVVVSDNMMPGMRGVDLLAGVKDSSPDTVRILMTAYADLPTAIDAINRGEVFRFVVKPWENEDLLRTVEEGLQRSRLIRSLKRGDEATLLSLAQTIELKDPYTRGHCERVASYARMIASALDLPAELQRQIKHGSWLHDCGKIGVPEAILNFNGPLAGEQFEVIKKHPRWGADVACQARLPEAVINIILYHHERFDGGGYPSGKSGAQIPLEARIVAVADVFDAITTDRPYQKGKAPADALVILASLGGTGLDPDLVDVFVSLRETPCAPAANVLGKG